jgi:predicted ArsR family transcriptional regulator
MVGRQARGHVGGNGRRHDVLTLLQGSTAPLSIIEIAGRLGVHPNTARHHLEALVERGRVQRIEPGGDGPARPGRPALRFRALPGMDPEGPRNYRLLAGALAHTIAALPDARARALDSGRSLGRQLAATRGEHSQPDRSTATAVEDLVDILDDLGFAPERRTSPGEAGQKIDLRHCAFLELIDDQAEVICQVHLGLMRGALETLDPDLSVETLDPFVEPHLCVAQLGRAVQPRRARRRRNSRSDVERGSIR